MTTKVVCWRPLRVAGSVIVVVFATACASVKPTPSPTANAAVGVPGADGASATTAGSARSSDSTSRAVVLPRGRANLISEAEIKALIGSAQTALEVVQRLRPAMLRSRNGSTTGNNGARSSSASSPNEPHVYFDGQPMGGLRALGEIMISQIREIRYLTPTDATTMFGTGNPAGAIQVFGRR
jgi:hypothetical protein